MKWLPILVNGQKKRHTHTHTLQSVSVFIIAVPAKFSTSEPFNRTKSAAPQTVIERNDENNATTMRKIRYVYKKKITIV